MALRISCCECPKNARSDPEMSPDYFVGRGGEYVRFQDLRRVHPGKVCICQPHLRDLRSHRVVSWICLQAVDTVDAARAALERLDLDGVTDAVPVSTDEQIVIEGDLAARYFRVFFGLR